MRPKNTASKVATLLLLCVSLTGCIHAQSTATGTSTSIGTSVSGSSTGTGAVCNITTTSIPPGTVGVVYTPVTLTTTGCVPLLTWSISAGSLPTGLSLNASTGVISGTPTVAGSSSPTFHVVDTNSKSDIFDTALSIAAAPSGSTPVLPDSTLLAWDTSVANTPSPVVGPITVGDGSGGPCALTGGTCSYPAASWATAWAAAGCGQTVINSNTVLTLAGNFTLNKVCDSTHWITISYDTTDATFPAEGTRVTPCYSGIPSSALAGMPSYTCVPPARHMPYIQKTSAGATINIFGSYYRFVGIEWGRNNSYDLDFGIINMAISSCTAPDLTCMNAQPTFNIFDRNIIHGDAQRQTAKAIALGGTRWVAVLDSYIYDISETYLGGGGDANPFGWGNGKNFTNSGFGKFHNNFIEASTMGNLFCGAFTEPLSPSTGFDGVPHDVWFKQNWYFKKILWDTQLGQTQGVPQTIEGVTYPAAADQEFIQLPSAIQLAVNQAYQVQTWTANDSNGGINRSQAGTNTLTCGGGTCGTVNTVFSTVGSGIHQSISQFITTYTAPASIPPAPVRYTRCWTTGDGRAATIGANRSLCASTDFTIVASVPVAQEQLVIGPAAPDLGIQPSYSDAFGNSRQFALQFNAIPNFANLGGITWQVDGIAGGNSAVGTIDSTGLYTAPATTGAHTIGAQTLDSGLFNISGSSTITVSSTAPIVGFDGRPNAEKNGWELKCGSKILMENTLIENSWGSNGTGGGQGGQTFLIHPFNQNGCAGSGANCNTSILSGATNIGYGPFFIADITLRYIKAMHMGAGFVIGGNQNTLGIRRVSVANVLCDDCSFKHNSHGFNGVTYYSTQFNGGPAAVYSWESSTNPMSRDISYSHITDIGDVPINLGTRGGAFGIAQNAAQPLSINYVMQDSIFAATGGETFYDPQGGTSCNTNGGVGVGNTELKGMVACFSSYTLNHLALLDSTTSITAGANWPNAATLWQPASSDAGLFRNYNGGVGGDYRVVAGGIYDAGGARQSSDSTALGADIASLSVIEQNVRNGVTTGLPCSISTSNLPSATHNVAYSQTLAVSGGVAPYTWSTPADITPSGAIDILDYAAMPLPDRNSFHLSGTIVKYFKLDAGLLWWIKNTAGNPWDGEVVGSDYIKQWFTEGATFGNASGFKMYQNPPSLWKRYHVPGADDVVYTPGPNKYSTTANCGADGSPLIDNLGVRGELTGPFTDVTWQSTYGGSIPDGTPYLLAQKWIKCTSNNILNCTNEEDYWLVKGYGQVRWCPKTLSGGVYVTGSCSQETTKVAGGAPTPNFACGLPQPPTSTLPPGALLTSGPAMTLVDSTGVISGTPNAAGTYTFTVQVEDAVGHIATKAFTLTVN